MASSSSTSSTTDDKTDESVLCGSSAKSEASEPSKQKKDDDDPELNALLDSALEDFDNQPKHPQPSVKHVPAASASGPKKEVGKGDAGGELSTEQEALFNEMFTGEGTEDGFKEFEETMRRFMHQDPEMLSQFENISKMAASASGDEEVSEQDFADTLAQTLSGMAQNAEGLKEPLSDEDLMKAFSGMGVGGNNSEGDFMPMMQGMMKNLLSKEVLYPSLKEISEKYPKWLDENKEKTDGTEFENYQKQYSLMKHICVQFESETPTDTEACQTERFEKILDLMQQMQELGHPPKEIVGEMAPGLEFDESGLPKLPSGQQCCVM